mgnify:FL=1
MKKINILVTTVGGLTSPDILKAYKDLDEYDVTIVGTDAFEFAVGKKFVDVFRILPYSGADELGFAQGIEDLIQEHDIDIVIPCGNEDNLALAKYKNLLSSRVMVGEYDSLIEAYDKGKVYDELKKSAPEYAPKYHIVNDYQNFLKAVENLGYPDKRVVVKPRFGRGGRGVYVLSNQFNFENIFKSKPINEYPFEFLDSILKDQNKFNDLIVMEDLSDPYHSIYSICKDGENIFTLNHIREWGDASQTFRGKVFYDEEIEKLASKIIKTFNLSYTNNMELAMSEDGRMVLFDLNPRIGASSGIDKDIGFNFPLESLRLTLGESVSVDKSKFVEPRIFLRYFDHVWI